MLYAIVDPQSAPGGNVVDLASRCLDGGARYLQLRAKLLPDVEVLRLASALVELSRGRAQFFLNDRPDLAALCGADGAHVGQDDLPALHARRALRPEQQLGLSTHTDEDVRAAVLAGVDLMGFGPVFPSGTKQGHADVTGPEGLARAVALARGTPVVAIGGITEENAAACGAAGAHAVAVIGALAQSADPAATARRIIEAFERGRAEGKA
ncbi:MAG: thiamine phosphate synthase [Myxococcota bacterium]